MSSQIITTGLRPRIGTGVGAAHFGELMQGALAGGRVLLSLPCPLFQSEATFSPSRERGVLMCPSHRQKARLAAETLLAELDTAWRGGFLSIRSNVPVSRGLGSSTADCVAALRAVASALGATLTSGTIARIAVSAESAADSTMFPSAVLFLHREGRVLEDLGAELPALEVLGFDTGPSGRGVDTLTHPQPRYEASDLARFAILAGLARQAVAAQDVHCAGFAATGCARVNQRFLPKPRFDDLERIASESGALGIVAAHSGTVAGLLFDPKDKATPGRISIASRQLARMGIEDTWRFITRRG